MTCPNDLLDSLRWAPQEAPSKMCSACHETFPIDNFHKDSTKKDGKQSRCKACVRAWNVATYERSKSSQTHSWPEEPSVVCSDEFTVTQELVPDEMYIM